MVVAERKLKSPGRILVVDDEVAVLDSLCKRFAREGYATGRVSNAPQALGAVHQEQWDLALIDIEIPATDGTELHNCLREVDPELIVILMTGDASVKTAVAPLKRGAYDYINKPVDPDEVVHLVSAVLRHRRDRRELARLREKLREICPEARLIGESLPMKYILELVQIVAPTDTTVLISGESGTGKEHLALAIHAAGPRRYLPMVVIHCGALSETLLESEPERSRWRGGRYAWGGRRRTSALEWLASQQCCG
jgi:DNA-binding NtrC family response regulator